jgi:AcrR family transcriptional regulator
MESDPSPHRRGDARKRLESAVRELLDEATLAHLLRFITVTELVRRSGTSNGAIYKAARSPAELARRTVSEASVDLGEPTRLLLERFLPMLARVDAGEVLERAEIAGALADNVLEWAVGSGRVEFTAALLSAAVSCSDPEAAAAQKAFYDDTLTLYAPVIGQLLQSWNREPIDDFDTAGMALLIVSLGDGLALRARFDPAVTVDLVQRAFLALWAGTSRPVGVSDDNLDSRLLPDDERLRVVSPNPAAADEIGDAVRTIYRQQGWPAVSISSVSRRTGLSRGAILAAYGDRDGLALAIWRTFLPAFERLVTTTTRLTPAARAEALLTVVVERAHEHPGVTESLLASLHNAKRRAVGGAGRSRAAGAGFDPSTELGLLPLLAGVLEGAGPAFRPGFVDSAAGARRLAGLLFDAALSLALDEPGADAAELGSYLTEVFLQGALARRRARPAR